MAHMTTSDVNAWLEPSKLSVSTIEAPLEQQVSAMIIAQLAGTYNTTFWINDTNTPSIVRTIIAMYYAAWLIDRAFSDSSSDVNEYAVLLRQMADTNIAGLISGVLEFDDMPPVSGDPSTPVFFPNDASSANAPTIDNPHDGPAVFQMGQIF